jgi:hypothetical protein
MTTHRIDFPSPVVAQECRQLKSLPIEKSAFDSNVIAIPKGAETIHIRSLSIGRKRNDDPLSRLIAYFKGSALEVQLLHSTVECLDPGAWTRITAPTLIPILNAFLDADHIRVVVATRVLIYLHGNQVAGL